MKTKQSAWVSPGPAGKSFALLPQSSMCLCTHTRCQSGLPTLWVSRMNWLYSSRQAIVHKGHACGQQLCMCVVDQQTTLAILPVAGGHLPVRSGIGSRYLVQQTPIGWAHNTCTGGVAPCVHCLRSLHFSCLTRQNFLPGLSYNEFSIPCCWFLSMQS